jgi:hypothetical protein
MRIPTPQPRARKGSSITEVADGRYLMREKDWQEGERKLKPL